MPDIYLGLISGTSMDAIDAVAVDLSGAQPQLLAALAWPMGDSLRAALATLCVPGDNEVERLLEVDVELGHQLAAAARAVMAQAGLTAEQVRAIGCHGQTIRHLPTAHHPTTLQIGDANHIAEITGITTVADFRRRDMAAGGQGAPLVPAFHAHIFRTPAHARVILNIGGIANITCLPADEALTVTGYDTGPGNTLLDAWYVRHHGGRHDDNGAWGRQGRSDAALLEQMLADPWFDTPPPRSTGREYFNLDWLMSLAGVTGLAPEDVQATLVSLSVETIATAIEASLPQAEEVLVCGGGVYNGYLMERLAERLAPRSISSTAVTGVDPDWVEAMAFAWLAQRTLNGRAGNLPAVTGARHPVILGAIYPGTPHQAAD